MPRLSCLNTFDRKNFDNNPCSMARRSCFRFRVWKTATLIGIAECTLLIGLSKAREYPKIPVYLGVAGLIVQLFSAASIYILPGQKGWLMGSLMGQRGMAAAFITMGHSSLNALLLSDAVTMIFLAASLASVILMARGTLNFVRIGSVLLIVSALLSATTTFGLILGGALMFAAGIAGMVWAYTRAEHL